MSKWYNKPIQDFFKIKPTNEAAIQNVQYKSHGSLSQGGNLGSFADYLNSNGQGDLRAFETLRLYKQCQPLFTAVNMRAEAFAQLKLRVYDTKNEEFIDDHPVLDLLAKPNPDNNSKSFLKAYASYYDITGDTYLVATGDPREAPLEVFIEPPQNIVPRPADSGDYVGGAGVAGCYVVGGMHGDKYKLADGELGGSFRYYDGDDRELWHTKDFNPFMSKWNMLGMPKASPLWLQIQQFVEANINNYSMLARGARPSLAWVWQHDTPMTDEQFERWREQVKAYEGAANAGRQLAVDNMKPEQISQSNSDMEFSENRKTVKTEIFGTYEIPLPLVAAEQMTLDNLKTSTLLFYDNAVLPLADTLLDSLSAFLLPRYPDSEGLIITYNANEITAIRQRMLDETATEKGLGVLTYNEIRSQIGREALAEGGDVILVPQQIVAAGVDGSTGDNLNKPDTGKGDKDLAKEHYVESMKQVVDLRNRRVFDDATIESMAQAQGL